MPEEAPVEQAPQAEEVAPAEEPSPLAGLLDEFDALKARVAQLEQLVVAHGHAFDDKSITQIAQHVFRKLNDAIRMRGQSGAK